jgi:23S rRNA (adenine2503-C2)-methyltransferase
MRLLRLPYLCAMISTTPRNIRHLSLDELLEYFLSIGEKKFRARQVYEWLWKKNAASFEAMTDLSKDLREHLEFHFTLPALSVNATQYSADGTIKSRFKTYDGHLIEGVIIPTEKRFTACVSSQVGCSLTCRFCATGKMERKRNLDFDEIYNQVATLNQQAEQAFQKRLSNVVFMGMGEPLLNYKNVVRAIEKLTANDGMAMSPNRITISTAGVAKQIKQLGDDQVRAHLALSLHAADDKKRNTIMPINESNNIAVLVEALNYYYQRTKNDITLEYILFKDLNDSLEDAKNLVKIYRQIPTHLINIIEYNPIEGASFEKPDEDGTKRFTDFLVQHRVNVRIRRSRGKDIDAACGQLANKG